MLASNIGSSNANIPALLHGLLDSNLLLEPEMIDLLLDLLNVLHPIC